MVTKDQIIQIERVQHRFLNMVSLSMCIIHEPHDYKPVLTALNLSTLSEKIIMSDIKLLNGLVSGVTYLACYLELVFAFQEETAH